MAYTKTIVCLAHSTKTGGYCVAGKELQKDGYGGWVRPVSARASAEVSAAECTCDDGKQPQLLDIIEIPLAKQAPDRHQIENHEIDAGKWKKIGTLSWEDVNKLVDKAAPLWIDGQRTYSGVNDCVSAKEAEALKGSLVLIRPDKVTIRVGMEGDLYQKRAVRAYFKHAGVDYALKVTDPVADEAFRAKKDGEYVLEDVLLCVSLTEPYDKDKRCHKLAAAIISKRPF
jgi:hypothetical protein